MKQCLYFLVCGIIFFHFACSETEEDENLIQSVELNGIWEISPSDSGERLDFSSEPGYALLSDQTRIHSLKLTLLSDGSGLRIQDFSETSPIGYFLWKDRKKESWTGIWRESLVRMVEVTR
jgi:hypothetical protein